MSVTGKDYIAVTLPASLSGAAKDAALVVRVTDGQTGTESNPYDSLALCGTYGTAAVMASRLNGNPL